MSGYVRRKLSRMRGKKLWHAVTDAKIEMLPASLWPLAHVLLETLPARERVGCVGAEELACGGQRDAPLVSLEERLAHLALEPLDRSRESGRAEVALAAGLAEVQGAGKMQEKVERAVVHLSPRVALQAT